jgi:hypothetical protein
MIAQNKISQHHRLSHFALGFLIILLLGSCVRQNDDQGTTVVFTPHISMRHQDTLNYDLGHFATESQTLIVSPPYQGLISMLRVDSITQHIHYIYQPEPNYIGQELVIIDTKSKPYAQGPSPTAVRFEFYIDISF